MAGQIRVRMYRVGFGDCFLMTLPIDEDGQTVEKHVIVDCGVFEGSGGSLGNIQTVVDHIETTTGGKIALIVASHAHKDHVLGFDRCEASFNRFQISEIWLPWTDNPHDPVALDLKTKELSLAQQLDQHLTALAALGQKHAFAADAVANATGNQTAMQNLQNGFASHAKVSYLKADMEINDPAGLAGLRVKVLGPPTDVSFFTKQDPPKSQRYLRLNDDGVAEPQNIVHPFGRWWRRSPAEVARDSDFDTVRLDDEERKDLTMALTEPMVDSLALMLDDVRNNTSLVLLFEYNGKTLLFPGDAQWGNWKSWLDKPDAPGILQNVDFLKVAHHGSVNASPKQAIEQLGPGVSAMISTQNKPWPSIPRPGLVTELKVKTNGRVLESDSIPFPNAPVGPVVDPLPAGFTKGAFWFDYLL